MNSSIIHFFVKTSAKILEDLEINIPGSAFAGSGSEDGSARGMARLVRICRFKFNLVLLNVRGRNGCGRMDGAAVVVVVVDDGGSVIGSAVVGSKNCIDKMYDMLHKIHSTTKIMHELF